MAQKKRILVIDGNYFAHRSVFGMQISNKELTLETPQEQAQFKTNLFSGLISVFETFNNDKHNLLHQVIFVSDDNSWRKLIPAHKPYYIADNGYGAFEELIGYKENRKEKKENDTINWDIFDRIYTEFVEVISSKIIVFKNYGLEGDDQIMLLKNRLTKDENENWELVVLCTDGDLNQVVNDKCMLFRNISSKLVPAGEFVLSPNKYREIFIHQDPMTALLGNTSHLVEYDTLFSIQLNSTQRIKRELNTGISIATPHMVALVKSISGDKKDNIFPILRWKSKNGAKNMKVTEGHIEKALKMHGHELNDKTCALMLQSKEDMLDLLLGLCSVTGQDNADLKELGAHFKHNMKINILAESNIPQEYVAAFNTTYAENYPKLINQIAKEDLMFSSAPKHSDNILVASAPDDILDIVNA